MYLFSTPLSIKYVKLVFKRCGKLIYHYKWWSHYNAVHRNCLMKATLSKPGCALRMEIPFKSCCRDFFVLRYLACVHWITVHNKIPNFISGWETIRSNLKMVSPSPMIWAYWFWECGWSDSLPVCRPFCQALRKTLPAPVNLVTLTHPHSHIDHIYGLFLYLMADN